MEQNLKPIIFIFGPSGVGKSHLSDLILEVKKFLKIQIEKKDSSHRLSFYKHGFPSEWDSDFSKVDFNILVNKLRQYSKDRAGILFSFPTDYRLTIENLELLVKLGVTPILLWASESDCK